MKIALFIFLLPLQLLAATYFVDFDAGTNASAGTATGTAWKHCPGDPNATGSANITLAAGDTVNFKGGVAYRGYVSVNASGSAAGGYITYQGDAAVHGWGTGKAIIDGTVDASFTWTPCANAADCYTNANWANIYYSPIPTAMTNTPFRSILVDSTSMLPLSQDPNPTNRMWIDQTAAWYTPTSLTSSTCVDTVRFTNPDPNYYRETRIGRWLTGNEVDTQLITGFDPANDRITNSTGIAIAGTPLYSLFNHPALIDQAGEYAVRTNENRIYYWPLASDNPSSHTYTIGTLIYGFVSLGKSYTYVNGFVIRGQFGEEGLAGRRGMAFESDSVTLTQSNTVVANCEIKLIRSMSGETAPKIGDNWLITVLRKQSTITNNFIHDCFGGGIFAGGDALLVTGNVISNMTRTGMYINSATNALITNNVVKALVGTHAQGVSIYGQDASYYCNNVRFERNIIQVPNQTLTMQYSTNVVIANNIFDHMGSVGQWSHFTHCHKTWIINNLILNNSTHNALSLGTDWGHTVINNIIDGGGVEQSTMPTARSSHNLYVGFASIWGQSTNEFYVGDTYDTNLAGIFVDFATYDYRLKTNSPALNTGTNAAAILWDGTGVNFDYAGTARPQGSDFDLGAYEGASSATSSSRYSTLFQGNIRAQGSVIFR